MVRGSSDPFSVVIQHMTQTYWLESAIHRQLAQVNACSLDELVALLRDYSWAQVFPAVDRLRREGPSPSHIRLRSAICSLSHRPNLPRHDTRCRPELKRAHDTRVVSRSKYPCRFLCQPAPRHQIFFSWTLSS